LARARGHGGLDLLAHLVCWRLQTGRQIVGSDIEDLSGQLDTQGMAFAQVTVNLHAPTSRRHRALPTILDIEFDRSINICMTCLPRLEITGQETRDLPV
jgi:hypothetical protein